MVPCGVYKERRTCGCQSAWLAIYPNLRALGFGGNLPYFDEKGIAITCCTGGMRPVIFKIERI